MAVMMMITTMITLTATPPEPMIGTLKLSRESRKDEAESSIGESIVTLLRAKTVSLNLSFSSFQCCSMILMRWLAKCTTCVSPDLMGMELQLMRVDWSEQARGSRSFVSEDMVHSVEGFVVLEGQVSVIVRLPFRRKWKSSNRGLGEGVTVAFTEV